MRGNVMQADTQGNTSSMIARNQGGLGLSNTLGENRDLSRERTGERGAKKCMGGKKELR